MRYAFVTERGGFICRAFNLETALKLFARTGMRPEEITSIIEK